MKVWILVTALIGAGLLGLAFFFFVKASMKLTLQEKKGRFLLPNLTLLLLSLGWLGFAGFLYLEMQNQINLFLK